MSMREKYGQPIGNFFLWTSITILTMEWFYSRWELEELKNNGNDRLTRLEKDLSRNSQVIQPPDGHSVQIQ